MLGDLRGPSVESEHPKGNDLFLAIDSGTQSVRALLFDARGELAAKAAERFEDYSAPQPGWLEHDVEGFWEAAVRACQRLWASDGDLRARVRGLAVTTQRGTLMAVDREGRSLRPAITWLDQRKASSLPGLKPWWTAALWAAGGGRTVRSLQQ